MRKHPLPPFLFISGMCLFLATWKVSICYLLCCVSLPFHTLSVLFLPYLPNDFLSLSFVPFILICLLCHMHLRVTTATMMNTIYRLSSLYSFCPVEGENVLRVCWRGRGREFCHPRKKWTSVEGHSSRLPLLLPGCFVMSSLPNSSKN